MEMRSMCSAHVAHVSLMLNESEFDEFKCDCPSTLGTMKVDSLSKILDIFDPADSLTLKCANDSGTMSFHFEACEDGMIADFDLKLEQTDIQNMEIPEQQYKVVVKLHSAKFASVLRVLAEFGKTISFCASSEGIRFITAGNDGTGGNILLKPSDSDEPEGRVHLT